MGPLFYIGIGSLVLCLVELISGRSLVFTLSGFARRDNDPVSYWRDVIAHFAIGIGFLIIGFTYTQ